MTDKPKKSRTRKSPQASTTGKHRPVADQTNWRHKMLPNRIKFDDEAKLVYLTTLERSGLKNAAALEAGVTQQTVLNHLETDEEFAAAYDVAFERYKESVRDAVRIRGRDGWLEPVYHSGERAKEFVLDENGNIQFDADGNAISKPASVRKFSDRLLELEAKRVDHSYRDKLTVDGGSEGGTIKKITLEFVDPSDVENDSDSNGGDS